MKSTGFSFAVRRYGGCRRLRSVCRRLWSVCRRLWNGQRYLGQARHALESQLLGEVAGHPVLVAYIAQRRALGAADILRVAAARVEVASRRRIRRAWHVAGQLMRPRTLARVGLGDGR